MKWFIPFILLASLSAKAQSGFNMVEVRNDPRPMIDELAASTAAMVAKNKLTQTKDGDYLAHYQSLKQKGYCSDFPMANQLSLSECSGTLISDRHILTAGHCADLNNMCSGFNWVFDFQVTKEGAYPANFLEHQVYSCKKIVASINVKKSFGTLVDLYKTYLRTDFAIIELDRPVMSRKPVKLSTSAKAEPYARVFSISYPLGTPAKVNINGEVQNMMNTHAYFWTSLIVFPGSSGGPIFNEETGELMGVISRGIPTTAWDRKRQCMYEQFPNEISSDGQSNSNAQMKKILEVIKQKKLPIELN